MKFTNTGIQSIGATVAILVLLLSAGAFAYTTRIPVTNNHNNAPAPLDDNDSTTTSTTSSGSERHGSSSHTESEHHTETQTSSTTHTETSESKKEHETETQATTSGSNNNQGENSNDQEEHELKFRIVPATQGFTGQGEVNIAIHGTVLKVDVEIEKAEPSTTYDVVLFAALTTSSVTTISPPTVSSSTTVSQSTISPTTASTSTASSQTLGTIVTNDEGDGHLHTELQLPEGTYQLGIVLSVSGNVQLTTHPEMQTAILSESASTKDESEGKGENKANHVVKEEKQDEDEIKQAEDSNTIPAVIQVTSSGSTVQVLDSRFSVSIGRTEGDGLAISISANNVTGPKVLLINLTNTFDPASRSLNVTLDGKAIQEASSVAQVLSPSPADPPRFLIVTTTSGSQLLVSIPHFSLHIIQVLPFALTNTPSPQNFLTTNGFLLIGSAIAIVAVSAALIVRKRRIQP